LVLGLSLVVKVSILELVAHINAKRKFVMSFWDLITFDEGKHFLSIDLAAASFDDSVADLSYENHKSRRSVVVLRVGPNKQNSMHNWNEQLSNVVQLLGWISKLVEQLF